MKGEPSKCLFSDYLQKWLELETCRPTSSVTELKPLRMFEVYQLQAGGSCVKIFTFATMLLLYDLVFLCVCVIHTIISQENNFQWDRKKWDINRRVERHREKEGGSKRGRKRQFWLSSFLTWRPACCDHMLVQVDLVSRQLYQSSGCICDWIQRTFQKRGVRKNNAAIICQQVRSPGLAEPDFPSGHSTGSSFRLYPVSERHSHKVSGGKHWHFCFILLFSNESVSTVRIAHKVLNWNEE